MQEFIIIEVEQDNESKPNVLILGSQRYGVVCKPVYRKPEAPLRHPLELLGSSIIPALFFPFPIAIYSYPFFALIILGTIMMQKKAVILFSGGLDSTTCIAIAKSKGYECYALSFDYGQKHKSELSTATKLATLMGIQEHKMVSLGLSSLGGSALTDVDIMVDDYKGDNHIPTTYVPARNTVFLSIALGWAEVLGAYDIFIGANNVDYSGYPDCRPEYLAAFEQLANLATKAGIEGTKYSIHAPLLHLTKSEIIQQGLALGVDYATTQSCYRADDAGRACGKCDSCVLRRKGFIEAGVVDPTRYF